ncbi:glycosyltransferase [Kaistia dalseonensis]|uniref:Chitooligosaccharide deacetylase n=1 Tax=Kaistia dalseonensis TaxID=410840 RepID=A0ABU0HDZ3_9HYPH|nr:polysaccharide deacetylase family protein [Kaistia dalseonensis]MCX5497068.1 glycosyltransferase [Kaistia dalseonensis]MDQ0439694.1 cellulose synthase/poly-beta-1,6-N-acetylglucosamine synthase-like glycosyltransferase/peptidoglycan/xylan/chitin deacetylase (PgdA/CDA1 family) [Kaistia dalseonensis]
MSDTPVFFDPTGRRATHLSWLGWAGAVASTLAGAALVTTLVIFHPGANIIAPARSGLHALPGQPANALQASADKLADDLHSKERALARAQHKATNTTTSDGRAAPLTAPDGRALSIGFYVNWDDNSYPSLKQALPHLDWVIPGWLNLQGPDMAMTTSLDDKALTLINTEKPGTPILPMIQNAADGKWDGAGLARMLADPAMRAARIDGLVGFIAANKLQGLTVDFETVPHAAQADLKTFLRELAAAFKPHGWAIALAVPFDDADWDYDAYASIVDYLILMAYDEHWEEGAPGSIAGQSWFEQTLDKRMATLDSNHTIVAIGNYGYDWTKGKMAEDLTFQEAVLAAQDSEASIDFDPDTENPHFSYVEDDGKTHNVWFLDGVTAFNQIHAADDYKPAGYALWRLGSEDPSIWSVMGRPYGAPAPEGLKTISVGQDIDIEGKGEILRIAKSPTEGARSIEIDPDTGDIDDQTYLSTPTPYVIQRLGDMPGKIALTFDDGPDPVWTPQILDILKANNVPATFFIIGGNASSSPDLVRRMVDEGHDVGNHTYTHPNMAQLPASVARLEINATQRLFEALTGRSMRLIRPPYFGDAEPTTRDEIGPVELAQSMGYTAVGLHVDPDDWQKPPADTIVQRVVDGVNSKDPDMHGNIVLLHDAGGDREQTVLALPRIIETLRAEGYQFVTVSELAGLTRDQAMPPVPAGSIAKMVDGPVFMALAWIGKALNFMFMAAIWLGVARLVMLCSLALINRRREKRRIVPVLPSEPELVSVLIPAHNEEPVIRASIGRLLTNDYRNIEIIVIDDGSTDATSAVVREAYKDEPRVTLLTIANGGKAAALNHGLARARGAIVVALDADTQFQPDTIPKLVRWFADPQMGAVAGNAKVGNRINTVTYLQALEYIVAQNLERRALAALGCITVVPGAVGAWRRAALDRLGGFPTDTLAEDQDLTIGVQAAGYKVMFESEAIAWTEAPDTLRGLAKQRFRWAYGTLQCLWKHRRVTFRPRYGVLGMVALPQVWLFQIALSLFSPLVDLMFFWQIVRTFIDYLQHGDQFDPTNLMLTGMFFALFMLVDISACVLAMALERTERWRLLWWLVLQRFGYRQLMYYVVVKSVINAVRGPFVGWGKLERKATVTVAAQP